jgi:branched-subunit amino acid ABC-type transport system permease component
LFEGSTLYMTNTLACAGNILLTSFFFHPILPLSIPIGAIGLTILYWVNKYILLRRAKRPEELSDLLATFFANLLPYALFFWALSMTLFYRVIFQEMYKNEEEKGVANAKTIPAWVIFAVVISLVFLPLRKLFSYIVHQCKQEPLPIF